MKYEIILNVNNLCMKNIKKLDNTKRYGFELFLKFLESKKLVKNNKFKISKEILKKYENYLNKKYSKDTTFNTRVYDMKRGLKLLFGKSQDFSNLANRFKFDEILNNIKTKSKNKYLSGDNENRDLLLSANDIKKLINKARENIGLFIEFLYYTGTRVSEMTNIELSNIKELKEYCEIKIWDSKSKKYKNLKVNKDLIKRIIKRFESEKWLFENLHYSKFSRKYVSWQIYLIGKEVLKKHISAHVLRHSFITNMIKKTGKIKAVSKYVGHNSIDKTLEIYTHGIKSVQEELNWEDIK